VVGVAGGGRMGSGIAHAFALAGALVVVVESDAEAAAAARARVARAIGTSVTKGATRRTADELLEAVTTTSDMGDLAGAGLVIEAVPELMEAKIQVLTAAAQVVGPTVPLATNTSSLPVGELAARLPAPERVIGLHFFNPVPASSLVEIVVAPTTSSRLVDRAQGWVAALGKTPIVVADSPGFASSRLGVAIALEAMRMVEEGVASAEDIDAAMCLGYRHPTGPLRTTDLVGLDVRLDIATHLCATLGDRFRPPAILQEKVAAGQLGRKTGRGFFTWGERP
jgi:3-hydroxybutyryl-CoA dehydrogenase